MPDHFYVYPAYLDKAGSRAEGRRVPAASAAAEVTTEMILAAAHRLGFKAETESDKQYSRQAHAFTGRVKIVKKAGITKTEALRRIAQAVHEAAPPSRGA
jgi:signal recognition particle subunit SEC65